MSSDDVFVRSGGWFWYHRNVIFVRELNDSPSRDRWYPFSIMTRHPYHSTIYCGMDGGTSGHLVHCQDEDRAPRGLLLTPRSLEGLTVFAASNVILQLVTSADDLLNQHKSTLSALSFYCFNRRLGSPPTPTVGSTLWFPQFPVLRQLCLCISHIGALPGFHTTPTFLRMMVHSPSSTFYSKGSGLPNATGYCTNL
jgi:hypothetical protein